MDQFIELVKDFFNQPIPIIGCSVGFALIFVLTVISKTSLGKKALVEMKNYFAGVKAEYEAFKKLHNQYVADKEQEIALIKEQCEKTISQIMEEAKARDDEILAVLSEIPNKKVQEKLLELKKQPILDQISEEIVIDKQTTERE